MGIRACARTPPHFGSTACMVYMTVRENQMPDISRMCPDSCTALNMASVLLAIQHQPTAHHHLFLTDKH